MIGDAGKCFDPEAFVSTLKDARVNSMNIFAKCHHGMCYYPTKVGKIHPSLHFDLMGTMIDVLHKNVIRCPIYFPLGWEEDAADHTDWLEIGKDGIPGHKLPEDASYNTWRKLCLNNREYRAYIKCQLREILENYEVDGFWFDIIFQQRCICSTCLSEMRDMGLDPERENDVLLHDELVLRSLQRELNEYISGFNKQIPVFYNSSWRPNTGRNGLAIDVRAAMQDHMEIESLPSGVWGYNHFPLFVNYHNRNNGEVIGMNGKFHLTWGDHGSLKNAEALEFECFRMPANGCGCSIGDQLHPRGEMNRAAYARIGTVYREIEKLEPFVEGSRKVADIGIVVSTDFFDGSSAADEGAMRMLMELHYSFDFIPVTDAFEKYALIILPDRIEPDAVLSGKLRNYLAGGGKVIATCRSTDPALGVEYLEDCPYEPAYLCVEEGLIPGVEPLEYVCYGRGAIVTSSLPVKAYIGVPYFNHTADCFSSHRQFPFDRIIDSPAILLGDRVGYCAFPLFADYIENGNRIYRDVIGMLLNTLLPEPTVSVHAPSSVECTVRTVGDSLLIFLLHYIPERRTKTIDIIDSRQPILDAEITLHGTFSRAELLRCGSSVPAERTADGRTRFRIPRVDGFECIRLLK